MKALLTITCFIALGFSNLYAGGGSSGGGPKTPMFKEMAFSVINSKYRKINTQQLKDHQLRIKKTKAKKK